ncbi:MAG: hypothetical protein EOO81_13400, partial [Oxalobacteraceae bacterium]
MSAAAAARSILTQLHDVMASRLHPQGKLNQVVEIIGETLNSEVCTIYLLRDLTHVLWHCANRTGNLNSLATHIPIGDWQRPTD